ncbi:MAG: GNAT family N-acetyltransferase [Leisingera sp.]
MQNKRGISQAFASRQDPVLEIRPAAVFDVFDVSRILTASVRDLCQADHGGDPEQIAAWTAGKSPEQIRTWIAGPGRYWLALQGGKAAGVCGLDPEGAISLMYVSPDAANKGLGSAMLSHLEAELLRGGLREGRLSTTRTALGFYRAKGWQQEAATVPGRGAHCLPMRKRFS